MKDYLIYLVPLLIIIIYLMVILKSKGKKAALAELRHIAFNLMLLSQKRFKDEPGSYRMQWVVKRFYPSIPNYLKIFITEEGVAEFLQDLYDDALDYLDDGIINNSIDKPPDK